MLVQRLLEGRGDLYGLEIRTKPRRRWQRRCPHPSRSCRTRSWHLSLQLCSDDGDEMSSPMKFCSGRLAATRSRRRRNRIRVHDYGVAEDARSNTDGAHCSPYGFTTHDGILLRSLVGNPQSRAELFRTRWLLVFVGLNTPDPQVSTLPTPNCSRILRCTKSRVCGRCILN